MLTRAARRLAAFALVGAVALAGCAAPAATPRADAAGIVLADATAPGAFNPISGYGELGVSPLYDGLMALHSEGEDALPRLVPALASAEPTHSGDHRVWTVPLRTGVTFHDGTAFDAADVVATYKAVLDPASASDIASSFEMVDDVVSSQADGGEAVTFTLKHPYADFPARLLLAIAPSEKLTGGPASESSLNREPVGTGPYQLAELAPDKAVFRAFPDYWGGAPQVSTLTTVHLPDDNTRVQRVAAGEFDGSTIPPALARTFDGKAGFEVVAAHSADWRGVSLPDTPFTADPRVRVALNHAVDRQAMVDAVLAGHGTVAHTPVSSVYGAAFDPDALFAHDVDLAQRLLAEAGWVPGSDGVRTRGADRASLTVAYRPTDTVRRDLSTAFAADMKKVGVEVRLEGMDFDRIRPRIAELGVLLGGGDKPYSLDTQVYGALHTQVPGGSPYDNPGDFGSAALDETLDTARRTTDQATRTGLYRQVQSQYLENPGYVFLAFLDHTYAVRTDAWDKGPLTVEPHAHGVSWGPWWNLKSWTR